MSIPTRWLGALLTLISLAPAARAGEAPPAPRSTEDSIVLPVGCADGVTAAQLSVAPDCLAPRSNKASRR